MTLTSTSFDDSQTLHPKLALGTPEGYDADAVFNVNPHLAWEDVPPAARSFVVSCLDPDAPVSDEGDTIPHDRPRRTFVHWVLYDVPGDRREIGEGEDSVGKTTGGKDAAAKPHGTRGQNDYTGYFEGDAAMAGSYNGYDGPYPPAHDTRLHRYVFTVYALGVDTLGLDPGADWPTVQKAMEGHVLEQASRTGHYTLNPDGAHL